MWSRWRPLRATVCWRVGSCDMLHRFRGTDSLHACARYIQMCHLAAYVTFMLLAFHQYLRLAPVIRRIWCMCWGHAADASLCRWPTGEKAQLSGSAQGVKDYDQQESGGAGAESTTPAGEAPHLGRSAPLAALCMCPACCSSRLRPAVVRVVLNILWLLVDRCDMVSSLQARAQAAAWPTTSLRPPRARTERQFDALDVDKHIRLLMHAASTCEVYLAAA